MIDATFKHRTKGNDNEYDAIIQAKRAVLRFDLDAKIVRAFLEDSEIQHFGRDADMSLINNRLWKSRFPPATRSSWTRACPAELRCQ